MKKLVLNVKNGEQMLDYKNYLETTFGTVDTQNLGFGKKMASDSDLQPLVASSTTFSIFKSLTFSSED